MKKIILGVAFASAVVSCQKIQAGGNLGVLRMEEGATRYSDDVMSDAATAKVSEIQKKKAMPMMDSGKVATPPEVMVKKDSAAELKATPALATPEKK